MTDIRINMSLLLIKMEAVYGEGETPHLNRVYFISHSYSKHICPVRKSRLRGVKNTELFTDIISHWLGKKKHFVNGPQPLLQQIGPQLLC